MSADNRSKNWLNCLRDLGVPSEFLNTSEGPCPKCQGKDRFRFNPQTGDMFCRRCHARPLNQRNGIESLAWSLGISAPEARKRVEEWEHNAGIKLSITQVENDDTFNDAVAYWSASLPISESPQANAYLRGRGLELSGYPELDQSIRFLPAGMPGTEYRSDGESRSCDTIIVLFKDRDGRLQAIQRIAVKDGEKAFGEESKRFVGSYTNSCAVLGSDTTTVVVCEGIETSLAVFQSLRVNGIDFQVRGAGSDVNLKNVPLPTTCNVVIIGADLDPDDNGMQKAQVAAEVIRKTRRTVKIAVPSVPVQSSEDAPTTTFEEVEDAIQRLFSGAATKSLRLERFVSSTELHLLLSALSGKDSVKANNKIKALTGLSTRDLHALLERDSAGTKKAKTDWLDVLNSSGGEHEVCEHIVKAKVYRSPFFTNTDISASAGELIEQLGCHPNLFQRGSILVEVADEHRTIEHKSEIVTEIKAVPSAVFAMKSCELIEWKQRGKDGVRSVYPDEHVLNAVISANSYPQEHIRPINGIVKTPIPLSDGRILMEPGFDESSGLFYSPAGSEYREIVVPKRPTLDDAIAAKDFIFSLVSQFPFRSNADRAAWLAEALTMVNQFRVGRNPLYLCEANLKGTGKGKLIDILVWITMGVIPEKTRMSDDDAEMAKKLLAVLLAGQRLFYLDNVTGGFGGDTLDIALTSSTFSERVLGMSKIYTGSIDCLFVASGNNAVIRGDLDRRLLLTRLETPDPNHSERSFQIPDLKNYLINQKNRSRYHQALLTIVRAFDVAGRPQAPLFAFGSFEEWSQLVRQTVVWLGEPDPLLPARENRSLSKLDDGPILRLMRHIWNIHGQQPFELSAIVARANPLNPLFRGKKEKYDPDLTELLKSLCGKEPDALRLSNKLRHYRDTPKTLDGIGVVALTFRARAHGGEAGTWCLKLLGEYGTMASHGMSELSSMPPLIVDTSESLADRGLDALESAIPNERVTPSTMREGGNESTLSSLQVEDSQAVDDTEKANIASRNDFDTASRELVSCTPSHSPLIRDWMTGCSMRLITSLPELQDFIRQMKGNVAWDIETSALDTRSVDVIVGHSLALSGSEAVYVPVRHEGFDANLDPDVVLGMIIGAFQRSDVRVLVWNYLFEFAMLRNSGINFSTRGGEKVLDVMVLRAIADNNGHGVGLKDSARDYLNADMPTFQQALHSASSSVKRKSLHFGHTDPRDTYLYGCSDALMTYRLFESFKDDEVSAETLCIEHELLDELPLESFMVDRDYVRELIETVGPRVDDLRRKATQLSGEADFNVTSSDQLGGWLVQQGAELPHGGGGKFATDEATLRRLPKDERYLRMVDLVLELRGLLKLNTSYLAAFLKASNPEGERFKYNTVLTATGRLSSSNSKPSDPAYLSINGQTMPRSDEFNLRRIICARPGCTLAAIDLSQIELRIAAHMSHEPSWYDAFTSGGDPHADMMGKLQVSRPLAKCCNFNLLYGGSANVIRDVAGISEDEAWQIVKAWKQNVPVYMKWYAEQKERMDEIAKRGLPIVRNMFGRERDLSSFYIDRNQHVKWFQEDGFRLNPEWGRRDRLIQRTIANTIIQSTAADINKRGIINAREYIRENNLPIRVIMNTHDELVFEISNSLDLLPICVELARRYTCRVGRYQVSLGEIEISCTLKSGPTYGDLSEVSDFKI